MSPAGERRLPQSSLRSLLSASCVYAGAIACQARPATLAVAVTGITLAAALTAARGEASSRRGGMRPLAWIAFIAFLAGFSLGHIRHTRDARRAAALTGPPERTALGDAPVTLEGRVRECRSLGADRIEIEISLDRGAGAGRSGPGGPVHAGARLTVPAYGLEPLPWRAGDRLRLTARLFAPRPFGNPGAFDYASYLRARRIQLVGSVKSPRLVEILSRGRPGAGTVPAWIRHAAVTRLTRAARVAPSAGRPDPEAVIGELRGGAPGRRRETAAFLAALLVGERATLPARIEQPLQRAGVFHIVALSGLNVAWAAGLVSAAARLLRCTPRARRLMIAAALAGYWWIVPTGGSIGRASLMGLLYVAAAGLGRRVTPMAALGVACVLMLLHNPAWTADPGFQLSLAATFGILLAAPARSGRTAPPPGAGAARAVRRSLRVSAAALLATALLGAHHFHRICAAALPANLAAVPLSAALLVVAAMVAVVEPVLPGAAAVLVGAAGVMVDGLVLVSERIAAVPGLSVLVVPPPVAIVVSGMAAMALAVLARRPWSRRCGGILFAAALLMTVAAGRATRAGGDLRITVLDVGQGDAVLAVLPSGATLLVDAGGVTRTGFDLGEQVVGPALRTLGHLRLDLLAVTHAHLDHIGGARAILRDFRPRALWLGRMPTCDPRVRALEHEARRLGIVVVSPLQGVRLSFGGVRLEVLNPIDASPSVEPENDDSLVLRLVHGRRAALLTGDIEGRVEETLAGLPLDLRADLLKVAHHGSRTSSSPALLGRVRPEHAAVSVGRSNPWGHPDAAVLERLRAGGARVHRTDHDGAAEFATDGSGPWRFRRPRRRAMAALRAPPRGTGLRTSSDPGRSGRGRRVPARGRLRPTAHPPV